MSYLSIPAYIHLGNWDSETRTHPAMKLMEGYTRDIIDGRAFDEYDIPAGCAPDWTLQKSTGEVFSGADKARAALKELYTPFSSHVHNPTFLVTWEI